MKKQLIFSAAALLLLATASPFSLVAQQAVASGNAHPTFHVDVKGQGAPIILIPGLASSGDTWDSTVAHYSSHYQCHVLTLAGFAGQPPVKDFSLDRVAADLSQYITAQKLTAPVIVGHSLGGTLALELAIAHPDQVGSLVIVDALPALGAVRNPSLTTAQLKANSEKMSAGMETLTEKQRLKMGRDSIETMASNPADVDRIFGWSKTSDWQTEITAMTGIMGTDLREQVASITAPTLVLGTWVEYAQYANEAAIRGTFEAQYKNLKGVRIAMAPKSRHFIMFDNPQWMFAQMDAFLTTGTASR